MEIETDFYYGAGYVSYTLTIALSVASFIAGWLMIGFSLNDNRVFWWLGVNVALLIVLQRWFMRLLRILWLFFLYDIILNGNNSNLNILNDLIQT